jgi:hypothetical protein
MVSMVGREIVRYAAQFHWLKLPLATETISHSESNKFETRGKKLFMEGFYIVEARTTNTAYAKRVKNNFEKYEDLRWVPDENWDFLAS